jgi:hypothetical protein
MKRKDFLRKTLLGGTAVIAARSLKAIQTI